MKSNRHSILFLLLLFLCVYTQAQTFAYKTILDTVPQNGFYRIPLSLEFLAQVKADLSDVRIKDERNQPVPFLLPQRYQGYSFISFPILKNTTDTAITTLLLDAGNVAGTNHINIIMGNTAVERFASLSGSNDQKQWYIINENLLLTNNTDNAQDHFVQSLQFPFIRYRYLKLQIKNKGTDPLPVIKAGNYIDTTVKENAVWYQHPGTSFQQKDSTDGYSYIWLHNQSLYPIDRINLQSSGTKFYQRAVQVYKLSEGKTKELLATTEFRSGEEPVITLLPIKTKDLLITIANGENPPLKLIAVNTFTRRQQLIAYLEKGKQYTLLGGNTDAQFPNYDLTHFRDSIPASLAVLHHGAVIPNDNKQIASMQSMRWWIWPAIAVMLLLLTTLTFKMMGEMKRNES